MRPKFVSIACISLVLGACGDPDAGSNVAAPGAPASAETRVLEAGTALLQRKEPVQALNVYLNGFHFYNGDMAGQMEAHHYCSVVNEEVYQCVIFDGNGRDAKLMGVEYIVSRRLFETLPETERRLWHSHVHEVKSGQLVAPGVPATAEREFMEKVVDTYGKTWHTWHTDRRLALPVGHPLLMMGFTADGQASPAMVAERDRRFGLSAADKRKERAAIPAAPVLPGADAWTAGHVLQLYIAPQTGTASHHAGK